MYAGVHLREAVGVLRVVGKMYAEKRMTRKATTNKLTSIEAFRFSEFFLHIPDV